MDFNEKFNQLKTELEYIRSESSLLEKRIAETEKDYAECLAFTDKFLKLCKKYKIKEVCIMAKNEIIKESMAFPFGVDDSVFANGVDKDGFPQIWNVVEDMNISGGCGNYNQHSIDEVGRAKLINGTYQFKDGKWNKLD